MSAKIQVQVRTFASLRQALGTASLALDLPSDATVDDLLERLSADYPAAASYLSTTLVAVNRAYADRAQPLSPGDEVAIFPPVSGGAVGEKTQTFVALSSDPIDPRALSEMVAEPGSGTVVIFNGIVRDNNLGRSVRYLEYEAYAEMAEAKIQQIVAESRERWPAIRRVAVVHRTGHLEIGEMAVLVAIGAPRRNDGAFEATRYVIDRIKEIVPIWKKEAWADGEEWLEGDYRPQTGE